MEIIPAIDIIEGKCVRLTQGDYNRKKIYHAEPLEMAMQFEDAGLKRLHLVDLDGAKAGSVQNWKVLEQIAGRTGMIVDFGGGVKSEKDVRIILDSGGAMVTIGSMAVKDESTLKSWFAKYGAEIFLLGADVRDEKITISGWLENTDIHITDFIRNYMSSGVQQIFCTDVAMDGAMKGPSVELYRDLIAEFPALQLIASGGVSKIDDLYLLQDLGCSGAIVGKAFYEGSILLTALKPFLQ